MTLSHVPGCYLYDVISRFAPCHKSRTKLSVWMHTHCANLSQFQTLLMLIIFMLFLSASSRRITFYFVYFLCIYNYRQNSGSQTTTQYVLCNILKMEAARSSKLLVPYQNTIRCHNTITVSEVD